MIFIIIIIKILGIKKTYGVDVQSFFDLMQRVAEEQVCVNRDNRPKLTIYIILQGIMRLDEEKLDEVVPLEVLKQFARDFINGFLKLMVSNVVCEQHLYSTNLSHSVWTGVWKEYAHRTYPENEQEKQQDQYEIVIM